MNKKQFLVVITTSILLGGGIMLGGLKLLTLKKAPTTITYKPNIAHEATQFVSLPIATSPTATANGAFAGPNLVDAAQIATPAVVHITATYKAKTKQNNTPGASPLDEMLEELKKFFGEGFEGGGREQKSQPQQATGSGVIITAEGYIVTNNHVIAGADQIEVTLDDNRKYNAQLIGQDPDTDLALLKIKEKALPFLQFGNSDALQVGEWILAVGNPFNLTSTVTKGIVSAKARTINSPQESNSMRISSFIQTDAAVNRGNSGGALVNMKGELVGINTAIIASNSGTFTGYSFAIPTTIVKKITDDLKKYGAVQRAMLGINMLGVDADLAKEKGLKQVTGIYIAEVIKKGAAAEAGIQPGDVIVAINNNPIKNTSQLQEQIACYKPNDKIRVTFYRKEKERTVTVTLKNRTEIVHKDGTVATGGATFEDIDEATHKKLGFVGGVRIKSIKEGLWEQKGMKKGFIILSIDRKHIEHLDQFERILKGKKGAILVEGFYPNDTKTSYYAVDLGDQ